MKKKKFIILLVSIIGLGVLTGYTILNKRKEFDK